MNTSDNKFLSVSYSLYSVDEKDQKHLIEQTQQGQPFNFITGLGFSLDAFEQHLIQLQPGDKFDFTLSPAEAFGEYDEEGVHHLKREAFVVNGKFDGEHIFPGAVITMTDQDDKRFMARVISIEEDSVTIDTNHPLAGETLQFTGLLLENRDATKDEIMRLLNRMSHECGGCDDCGEGGCGGCGGCH
ncbi:MAG: FKBP-type peptidyl-prolyl cis-trans isomerase [Prevotella sp.]|nr:FKBP-type peptidyl-prolyl cis-trans isomerase [Prevotella sp.]MBR0276643.1 FKBP-type peptidyl-prolyl cis-trans isomerase [Prevotella sp.]